MSKKQRKQRHVHVDRFATESARHQAEVARDQVRWEGERIDLELPKKHTKGDRKKQRTGNTSNTPPVTGE